MTAPVQNDLGTLLPLVDASRLRASVVEAELLAQVQTLYAQRWVAYQSAEDGAPFLTAALLAGIVSLVRQGYDAGVAEGRTYVLQQATAIGAPAPEERELPSEQIDQLVKDFLVGQVAASKVEGEPVVKVKDLQRRAEIAVGAAVHLGRNQATEDGFAQIAESLAVTVHKMWVARFDLVTPPCPSCARLHGMHIPLDEDFPVLDTEPKPYGGVLQRPPRHPRCRCSIVLFFPDQQSTGPTPLSMVQYADIRLSDAGIENRWEFSELSQDDQLVAATLVYVRPYTRVVNGQIQQVSGYYWDIQTGLKIPEGAVPSGAKIKSVNKPAAKGLVQVAKAGGVGGGPATQPTPKKFGPGVYEVAQTKTQTIVHPDGSSTSISGGQTEDAAPQQTQNFLNHWDAIGGLEKVSDDPSTADDPNTATPLEVDSETKKKQGTLATGKYLLPEKADYDGIEVFDDGTGVLYTDGFAHKKNLSAKAVQDIAKGHVGQWQLVDEEDEEFAFKDEFAKNLEGAEGAQEVLDNQDKDPETGEVKDPLVEPKYPEQKQASKTLKKPSLFAVGKHQVAFDEGSQVFQTSKSKDTLYVLDKDGKVTKYNPQGAGVEAKVVATNDNPSAKGNLLAGMDNVSDLGNDIPDANPLPGEAGHKVWLGGDKLSYMQLDAAIAALEGSPSPKISKLLGDIGSPLATKDVHAIAAPYKAMFNNKTKPAFLHALKKAIGNAPHTPLASVPTVAHMEENHALDTNDPYVGMGDVQAIHEAMHAVDPDVDHNHDNVGPGFIDVLGTMVTPEIMANAIDVLKKEKSTSLKGPLKKAGNPLAAVIRKFTDEFHGEKIHYTYLKAKAIQALEETLKKHQEKHPPTGMKVPSIPEEPVTVHSAYGTVSGTKAQLKEMQEYLAAQDLSLTTASTFHLKSAAGLPHNPFAQQDWVAVADKEKGGVASVAELNQLIDQAINKVLGNYSGPAATPPSQNEPSTDFHGEQHSVPELNSVASALETSDPEKALESLAQNGNAAAEGALDSPFANDDDQVQNAAFEVTQALDDAASGPGSLQSQSATIAGIVVNKKQVQDAIDALKAESSTSVSKPLKAMDSPLAKKAQNLLTFASEFKGLPAGQKLHYGKFKAALIEALEDAAGKMGTVDEPEAPKPKATTEFSVLLEDGDSFNPTYKDLKEFYDGLTMDVSSSLGGTLDWLSDDNDLKYAPIDLDGMLPGQYSNPVAAKDAMQQLVASALDAYENPVTQAIENPTPEPDEPELDLSDFDLETAEEPPGPETGMYVLSGGGTALFVFPSGTGKLKGPVNDMDLDVAQTQGMLDGGVFYKVSDSTEEQSIEYVGGVQVGKYNANTVVGSVDYDVLPSGDVLVTGPNGKAFVPASLAGPYLQASGATPLHDDEFTPDIPNHLLTTKGIHGFPVGSWGTTFADDDIVVDELNIGSGFDTKLFAQWVVRGQVWLKPPSSDQPALQIPPKYHGIDGGQWVGWVPDDNKIAIIDVQPDQIAFSSGQIYSGQGSIDVVASVLPSTSSYYVKVGQFKHKFSNSWIRVGKDGSILKSNNGTTFTESGKNLQNFATTIKDSYDFEGEVSGSDNFSSGQFADEAAPTPDPDAPELAVPAGTYKDTADGSLLKLYPDGKLTLDGSEISYGSVLYQDYLDSMKFPENWEFLGLDEAVPPAPEGYDAPSPPAPGEQIQQTKSYVSINANGYISADKPGLVALAKTLAEDFGYGDVAAQHLTTHSKQKIADWIRHWTQGEFDKAFEIEAEKVQKHKGKGKHPGDPANPDNAGGFQKKTFAVATEGELPAGQKPAGEWPEVLSSQYSSFSQWSMQQWSQQQIDDYITAANMPAPTGLNLSGKKMWVLHHVNGNQFYVNNLSLTAQKAVNNGQHYSDPILPSVPVFAPGQKVPKQPDWPEINPSKAKVEGWTPKQLDAYLAHTAGTEVAKKLVKQDVDTKAALVAMHNAAAELPSEAVFQDPAKAKKQFETLVSKLESLSSWDQSQIPSLMQDALVVNKKTYTKDAQQPHLKGHSQIFHVSDQDGNKYLFKVAPSGEEFRADQEDAVHQIAKLSGIGAAGSELGTFQGKFGQFQSKIASQGDLADLGLTGSQLALSAQKDAVKGHVFDWMIANDDSYNQNWLLSNDGQHIFPIDFGRSFAEFGNPDMMQLNIDHLSHMQTPIYKSIYKAAVNGSMSEKDMDALYKESIKQAKRQQVISDEALSAILDKAFARRGYYGKTSAKNAEELRNQILERKNGLVDDFENFWDDIYQKAGREKPSIAQSLADNVFSGNSADWHEHSHKIGAAGAATFFAGTSLEDAHMMATTVTKPGKGGSTDFKDKELHLSGHLSKDADAALSSWLKDHVTGGLPISSAPLNKNEKKLKDLKIDHYPTQLLAMMKTVSYHNSKGDKDYNTAANSKFLTLKPDIEKRLEDIKNGNFPPGADTSPEMKNAYSDYIHHYAEITQKIQSMMDLNTQSSPGDFKEFDFKVPDEDEPAAPEVVPDIKVTMKDAYYDLSTHKADGLGQSGEVILSGATDNQYDHGQSGHHYEIELPDGTVMEYRSYDHTNTAITQKGLLKIKVRNYDGTNGSTQNALNALQTMGVDLQDADEEDMELFYWRHLYGILQDRKDSDVGKHGEVTNYVKDKLPGGVKGTPALAKAEELERWREAWSRLNPSEFNTFLAEKKFLPRFNHTNLTDTSIVGGAPWWFRFDLDEGKLLEKSMPTHHIYGYSDADRTASLLRVVKSGSALSTEDRVKVLGQWYGGMSSLSDQTSHGSAEFLYTRMNHDNSLGTHTILFNPKVVGKTSNYSFPSDEFGEITYRKNSSYFNIDKATQHSGGGNEFMIKHAASLLDDMEIIIFHDKQSRDEAIAYLKSIGINFIRGLAVEDRLVTFEGAAAARKKARDMMKVWDPQSDELVS